MVKYFLAKFLFCNWIYALAFNFLKAFGIHGILTFLKPTILNCCVQKMSEHYKVKSHSISNPT